MPAPHRHSLGPSPPRPCRWQVQALLAAWALQLVAWALLAALAESCLAPTLQAQPWAAHALALCTLGSQGRVVQETLVFGQGPSFLCDPPAKAQLRAPLAWLV